MSYTLCPRCGLKALSIATQCPHCGIPFEIQHAYEASDSRLRRTRVVFPLVALGVIYLGVDTLRRGPVAPEASFPPPAMHAAPIPRPRRKPPAPAPSESRLETADANTSAALAHPATEAATDTQEPRDTTAPSESPLETAGADSSAALEHPATETGTDPQERRYTTIWANVREARRPVAPVVTVLQPGEPVLVDSLSEQWYRVVADGRKLGYVYRELVDTAPPGIRN